jgi:hypothetical protein
MLRIRYLLNEYIRLQRRTPGLFGPGDSEAADRALHRLVYAIAQFTARDLATVTDDELREEVRKRGYDLHSSRFSAAAQALLREIPEIRRRLDELEQNAKQKGLGA